MNHTLPFLGKQGRRAMFTALSALVLVAALLLGIGANALKTEWNSYVDATPEGLYTLTDTFLEEIKGVEEDIRIIFCDDPDRLMANDETRYVYVMAREIEKKKSNVTVETYNVERDPTAVQAFRATSSTVISSNHVIISTADGKRYRTLAASAFFSKDSSSGTYFAFNGEYKMASVLLSITALERPVAYFSIGHGESCYLSEGLSEAEREQHRAFYQLLIDSGIDVQTIDLKERDVPEDAVLLILNNPTEDFALTEDEMFSVNPRPALERIDRYLDNYGSLMVFKDPAVSLPALEEFLTEWGIEYVNGETVKDPKADADLSIDDTRDRFAVTYPQKDTDALGYNLFGDVAGLTSAPATVVEGSGYIRRSWLEDTHYVSRNTSAMTSAVFRSPEGAKAYNEDGKVTQKQDGDYVLARLSARVTVEQDIEDYYAYVFCAATTSLTDTKYLEDASLGNYDIMFATVRFISRTDAYASTALGGLNYNTSTFGGKRFQETALSDTPVEKWEKGVLIHTYPAVTASVCVAWTVLVLVPAMAVGIVGIVICVRRKHR